MISTQQNPPAPRLGLSTILKNASYAMTDLGVLVHQLEAQLLGDDRTSCRKPDEVPSLQMIDVLSQTIGEIAALLDRLDRNIVHPVDVDRTIIVSPIKIERLRSIIGTAHTPEAAHVVSAEAGHVALFE